MEDQIAAEAVNDERVRLLMAMPSLGYFAASLLVAEICDINRFTGDKKLVAGLDLLLAFTSLVIRLCMAGSPGKETSLSVGLGFRLLR